MADISSSGVKHNVAKGEGILTLAGEEQKTATSTELTIDEENGLSFIREDENAAPDFYKYF